MKNFFVILSALFALHTINANAIEPVDSTGRTFGLEAAIYEGSGTIVSQNWRPNVKYRSIRDIGGGIIEAHTEATLFSISVAQASARLKVKRVDENKFELLDLDDGQAKAGEGHCDQNTCSFKATVMKGNLTLEETWLPNESGFDIVKGFQIFNGSPATYEGRFLRKNF